ncbi:MAG: DUF2656 domain-containing protein [Prochlorococcus sp.]|nr:DUF2656 domain-containing protein [Prochlorococcus sp.]
MTTFVVSNNLQVSSPDVPALSPENIAEGLRKHCPSLTAVDALNHPHWMVSLDSSASSEDLANELVKAWRNIRQELGHALDHSVMALGGRKDEVGSPDSPLQKGSWGVDVVETVDPSGFLTSINWSDLKAKRPADGVFEVVDQVS